MLAGSSLFRFPKALVVIPVDFSCWLVACFGLLAAAERQQARGQQESGVVCGRVDGG